MIHGYNGKVKFVVENYGDSDLAKRFGVTRYPAIFVDDVLVAKPKDFGFYGKGEGTGEGRYTPWKDPKSHEQFRADLKRMIDLVLNNKKDELRKETSTPEETTPVGSLPAFTVKDLKGQELSSDQWKGKAVLVEFWATWCPPCRSTLAWLGELKKQYGDKLVIVAVAMESDESDVLKVANSLNLPLVWILGTPELAQKFGDISAFPTMFLFDPQGKAQASFLGAPPDLHQSAQAELLKVLK